ncbi:di-trans,poly-cis-decaprenylcistransferase [Candidatus Woesearchaeota archaeon]|nr:di-trans,poly-cis-decaprenylcistransferase [Nanoarchaeota archaeon]MCB9370713.1 di-trans,poly-cis-decaprenylcistransferase [Candidatus Woesearchaeota archaeon]USN43790.1 MAG: di-trans,poly-cis-decaprenylcistransferase [Candidatus Woesearchaeota archaeon]
MEHLAFIMDGNRRFAKKNGLSLTRGYQKGMEQFLAMVALQVKYGIKETSFWALSTDNYQKRSTDEKQTIFSLMKSFLELKANEQFFKENGIFVRLVGDIEGMQKQEKKNSLGNYLFLTEMVSRMKKWNLALGEIRFTVNIALNYGGQDEVLHAVKDIAKEVKKGNLLLEDIDEMCLKKHLYFNESKAPEVIVRSGDAPRLSGFMLWDCAYSEIYFTEKLWPELDEKDFLHILNWFAAQKRNFGQ